jgi:hypothetical protein
VSGGAKIAVYSCYFGWHEPFHPRATGRDLPGVDRFVFTDHDTLPRSTARVVKLEDEDGYGPKILSRLPKLCPHLFFQGYDWVIYVDNNARLRLSAARIERRVRLQNPDHPPGRYLFRHAARDCAWDEAAECAIRGHMTQVELDRVKAVLSTFDHPRHDGLYVNTCLIQRMGSAATDALNETWFDSLSVYTRRDQVMLPVLLRQSGCPYRVLTTELEEWLDWPMFKPFVRTRFGRRALARTA